MAGQSLRLKWGKERSRLLVMADCLMREEPQSMPPSSSDSKDSPSSSPIVTKVSTSPSPFSAFTPKIVEKRWDHNMELLTQQFWEKEGLYKFNVNSKKSIFTIDTPPPYPSGRPWHIGALAHYAQIDMIARTSRALGYETLFSIGIDRNGLPVERYVETTYKIEMRSQYQEKPTKLVSIAFKVKETGEELVIATTRPELMSSCQLIIVNPEDESYKKLHGLHAVVPIFEREVEIRPHPGAKREKGTGAVMICSYGDYHDVTIFRELGLQEIISIDERGRMTEAAGKFQDLTIEEARRKVIEELTASGLVRRILTIKHEVPTCERSGDPIEIIPMKEFYLKQLDFIPRLTKIAKSLKFHPDSHRQILLDWLGSINIDWPISRRRYYGTEIPVWYCKKSERANLTKPVNLYMPWP